MAPIRSIPPISSSLVELDSLYNPDQDGYHREKWVILPYSFGESEEYRRATSIG